MKREMCPFHSVSASTEYHRVLVLNLVGTHSCIQYDLEECWVGYQEMDKSVLNCSNARTLLLKESKVDTSGHMAKLPCHVAISSKLMGRTWPNRQRIL